MEVHRIGDEIILTIPLADDSEISIALPVPAGIEELVNALRECMSEEEWTRAAS